MLYKNKGIYKGAGIYKAGGNNFPVGYTKYDWIKVNPDNWDPNFTSCYLWLPIGNAVTNENTSFIVEYETYLNEYNNSYILTTANNPGGNFGNDGIKMQLRRQSNTNGGFRYVANTIGAFPGAIDLQLVYGVNRVELKNATIKANGIQIYNNPNIYNVVNISGKYISTLSDSKTNQKIYNVQILKDDVVIYDYYPCTRDNDGVIGFLDIVNNYFVRNQAQDENLRYLVGNG